MFPIPLQLVDSFLLNVNFGDALLVGFVFGLLAVLSKRSRKLVTAYMILFGLLFLVLPGSMYAPEELSLLNSALQYKLIGLVLLVTSPVLFATADS